MIEINLLPSELNESGQRGKKLDLDFLTWRFLAFISSALIITLIFLNLVLVISLHSKKYQLATLEKRWEEMLPQFKLLEQNKKAGEVILRDRNSLKALAGGRIKWSAKMQELSVLLPSGIWFNSLSLSEKGISLEASVFAPGGGEMELINRFISALSSDTDFSSGFGSIELGEVNRDSAGGYEILNFKLKSEFLNTARK